METSVIHTKTLAKTIITKTVIDAMNIRNLDWNLLPVLDALLRLQSVTLAARELDLSQSAVSSALSRLRAALGDELFVRTGRGLLPTPRATALAGTVATLLNEVRDRVLRPPAFDPAAPGPGFTINMSGIGSYVLWPRIVKRLRKQAPARKLNMTTLSGAPIASAMETGEIQVAIGGLPNLPDTLFQKRLFEREYVAMVRKGHPLEGKRLTVEAFTRVPQVVVRLASGAQELIDRKLSRMHLKRLDTLEMPSYLTVPPLVASGDYLAVVPGQLAEACARHGRFASLKLPIDIGPSVVRMYWHRRYQDDPANRWLREQLISLLAI